MTSPSQTGRMVAHYQIGERLGSGGMGDVYRARDTRLGRDVAVKFLSGAVVSDATRLARFEQEARAASALNHPNIVTIHEIGACEGVRYIVMELVEGQTLRSLLTPERPLPNRQLLDYAAQAAEGIAKAHAAGIVHRDLKPENLMVTRDGFVKILDFGLAKLAPATPGRDGTVDPESPTESGVAFRSPATGTGTILGTAGYMSPEQARGGVLDFRTDQFALGTIFYEMATGRRAFKRASYVQTLAAIIEAKPEPIAAINPGAPPALCWIVERCLEKSPADRYDSSLDLARDAREARERATDAFTPSGATSRRAATPRRWWRAAASLSVALGVVGVLAGGVGPWLRDRVQPRLPAEKRLAILRFANASGDAESQVFCDGLVEILTRELAQLERFPGSFWVVPASEVRAARVESAATARRALGVNLVLTGSVERAGGLMRLRASLLDATTVRPLRALALDSGSEGLAAIEDRVVRRVAEMLELELSPEAGQVLAAGRTGDAGAWDLYVQGRGHLQRYQDEESVGRAISAFQAALQKDPSYALAYAGMCEAHVLRYRRTKDQQSVELAQKACSRALALNDLLAPVHVTLGVLHTHTGQAEIAVEDLERALSLDPASGDAISALGRAQEALGRFDEAAATYGRAIQRTPGFWGNHSALGALLFRQGRYAEAEKEFRRVIELTPDNARGYANLGGALQAAGRDAEAAAVLERGLALGSYVAASNLGSLLFDRGDYAGAVRALEQAVQIDARDYRVWRSLAAAYHWAPGERSKAEEAYRQAAKLAEAHLVVDPRDATALVALADCLAMLGDGRRARDMAEKALALSPGDVEVMQGAGSVYEQLGDRARGLQWVNRALEGGFSAEMIEHDPSLEALRADPRFRAKVGAGPPASSGGTPGERRKP